MPDVLRAALAGRTQLTLTEIFAHGTRLLSGSPDKPGLRIVVAGSATTDLIARAIAVGCAAEAVTATISQSPFAAWRQEALDPTSSLHRFAPEIVVLVTDWRDGITTLPLDAPRETVDEAVAAKVAAFKAVWNAIARTGARVIQHLPASPPFQLSGVAELRLPAAPHRQIEALRRALLDAEPSVILLDTAALSVDARSWFGAKLPFAPDMLGSYVSLFRAALRSAIGLAKKVLVLDLDNTLWGGVIGDDGINGLKLGPETSAGEAYAAFQSYVKSLAARGIVLAACSKNDPAVAASGFDHPHSVLTRLDFAAFECSWSDKARGLRRIAETLNLGLNSIVFADDNPTECALVRQELPQVAVVELGADPAGFIRRLDDGHWFDLQQLGDADLARGGAYQTRARAQAECAEAADLQGFLSGLCMHGRVFPADEGTLARIAQLECKTNQFNLTTRRYDETRIRDFVSRRDAMVLVATLSDKFGDHGLVSSLIAVADDDALIIESWLMSCRVFSRTLEQFVMRALVERTRARGLARVVGRYAASAKNGVVADLFPRLGFSALEPERQGEQRWERRVAADAVDLQTHIVAA